MHKLQNTESLLILFAHENIKKTTLKCRIFEDCFLYCPDYPNGPKLQIMKTALYLSLYYSSQRKAEIWKPEKWRKTVGI